MHARKKLYVMANATTGRARCEASDRMDGSGAPLLDIFGRIDAKTMLEIDRALVFARIVREQVGGEGARRE